MKARICDKCGTIMQNKPIVGKGRSPIVCTILIKERRWEDDGLLSVGGQQSYDICEQCLKELNKRMEERVYENQV